MCQFLLKKSRFRFENTKYGSFRADSACYTVSKKYRNRTLVSFAKDADMELNKVTMDPKYQSFLTFISFRKYFIIDLPTAFLLENFSLQ